MTEKERVEREKLCKECLRCCKLIGFPTQYSEFDSFAVELYETRGYSHLRYKGKLWFIKEDRCPHLTTEGCDIYETRPAACKIYDGRTDPINRKECLWNNLNKEVSNV